MQITDVRIRKLFRDGILRAVASVTLDGAFVVHDVKVLFINDRALVAMPNRKCEEGYRDVAHPIVPELRADLEKAVLRAYESALAADPGEKPSTL
ncbi:MAG: SpoVG family protein [Clostridia bacterium]|nr:SpoVG family protein [Clostridia bacterium]